MSTIFTNCCISYRRFYNNKKFLDAKSVDGIRGIRGFCLQAKIRDDNEERYADDILGRRSVLASFGLCLASGLVLGFPTEASAAVKQGLLPGRIPGLSEPDENGWRTYRRPDEKSGGHGVGWSPIIPYTFKVPQGWEEVPVSIADLGGTEIDLRFASPQEGRLFVIVAPVLRFADLGDDAKIEQIGTPEKVINAFGPEVIGENVEGKVLSMEETEHSGRKYYQFELEPPHVLISATAAGNRFYLFGITQIYSRMSLADLPIQQCLPLYETAWTSEVTYSSCRLKNPPIARSQLRAQILLYREPGE